MSPESNRPVSSALERGLDGLRSELRARLRACLQTGQVTLASGRTTDFYIDGRQVTLDPTGLRLVACLAYEQIRAFPGTVTAVGGPTSGADPIVVGVGLESLNRGSPLKTFFTRAAAKGHGMMRRIEGPPLNPADQVVLVDDVATSGGSLVQAAEAVRLETGTGPRLALVVVDRQEGATERLASAGIALYSLFTRAELVSCS